MSTIESPGSLNDFRDRHPELADQDVLKEYFSELTEHRLGIAREQGVSPDELHSRYPRLGNTAIIEEGEQVA